MSYGTPTKLPGLGDVPGPRSASIASTPRAHGTPRQFTPRGGGTTPRDMAGSESSFEGNGSKSVVGDASDGRDNEYGRIGPQDPFPRPPRTAPSGLREGSFTGSPKAGDLGRPLLEESSTLNKGRVRIDPNPHAMSGDSFSPTLSGFAQVVPHGVSGSESVPQLKNFDVVLPGWINQGVSEQRTHLKLYYCDMLGRPKLQPPISDDAVEWEVEKLKEFVLDSKPKTRLDAYPLLVITQDILRRIAGDKIKIVSDRESKLQEELDQAQLTIKTLEVQVREGKESIQKLKIGNLMMAGAKTAEGDLAHQKEMDERAKALKEINDIMQKNSDEKAALAEEAERLKKLLAENRRQLENANRQLKASQQQCEAAMKQFDSEHKRKPVDVFASWSEADKQTILLKHILPDSQLLNAVGIEQIMKAWTEEGEVSRQLLTRWLLKEMCEHGLDVLGEVSKDMNTDRYEILKQWETTFIESIASSDQATESVMGFENFVMGMAELKIAGIDQAPKHLAQKYAKEAIKRGASEVQLLSQLLEKSEDEIIGAMGEKLRPVVISTDVECQTEVQAEDEPRADKPKAKKKTRKPLYQSAGSKAMPYDNVVRLIHEAYEVKIIADHKDDANNRPRQAFTDFLRDFLVRKYGLKSIATKHLGEIVTSVHKHNDQPVIRLFGLVSGMMDPQSWSPRTSDFVLNILLKSCEIEGRALSTISEWLNGDKEAGVSEDAAIFAASEVSTSRNSFMPIGDKELAEIKQLPKNEVGGLYVHDFLLWATAFLLDGRRRVKEGFMQLFVANDKNADGVLEFSEFSTLLKLIIPSDPTFELDERKISALYDEAASMDDDDDQDSISKEAFSEMACTHMLVCPPQYIGP